MGPGDTLYVTDSQQNTSRIFADVLSVQNPTPDTVCRETENNKDMAPCLKGGHDHSSTKQGAKTAKKLQGGAKPTCVSSQPASLQITRM